jgi:alpha-1,2-glucosyltransferase
MGTVVHPFLIADNRHFSFFLWRKFLSFWPVRIFLVPGLAATAAVYAGLGGYPCIQLSKDVEISRILFWFAITAVLVPSPLLEFRYFNLPLIFLLCGKRPGNFFNLTICALLVGIFCLAPFEQSGKISRFIL